MLAKPTAEVVPLFPWRHRFMSATLEQLHMLGPENGGQEEFP